MPAVPAAVETPQRSSLSDHPRGFWFFFWGEFAERCSYYGMRAILLLYMTERLKFTDGRASTVMSLFIAACYLLPLVGGYVADNFLGKYRTIVFFSLPYILGHVILGVESVPFLVTALGLLAMGTGVIKPNISTLMGMTYDLQRPGQTRLRSDAFAMFYGAINIGAAISSFAMPWIRTHYGYQIAFLFPAVLMVFAFLIFAAGKPFYAPETIVRRKLTPEEFRVRLVVLRRIFGLFLVVTFFWSIFDQSTTTWTLFARDHLKLTLHLDLGFWSRTLTLDPDSLQGLNPVLILVLLPPITLFWHFLARLGITLKATDKMLLGFGLATIAMGTLAMGAAVAGPTGRISILWEVIPYIIITAAEVCISVVGLELAFTAAPASMKGFVTACWFLTVFLANLLNSVITPFYSKDHPGLFFGAFALGMIPVTVAFFLIARRFNRTVARLEQASSG